MFDFCAVFLFYVFPFSIVSALPKSLSPILASSSFINHGTAFSKQPQFGWSLQKSNDCFTFTSKQIPANFVSNSYASLDSSQQQWKRANTNRKGGRRLQRTSSKMGELYNVAEQQSPSMDYWPTKASIIVLHDPDQFPKSSSAFTMLKAKLYPHIEF